MQKLYYVEHLNELKRRITLCLLFFGLSIAVGYYLREELVAILIKPLHPHKDLICLSLPEAFLTNLELAIAAAFFITLPYICMHVYYFFKPALPREKQKLLLLFLCAVPLLSYLACLFAYYLILPISNAFFLGFYKQGSGPELQLHLSNYIGLVLKLMTGFVIVFELPLLLILLYLLKVIDLRNMIAFRRFFVVASFIIAGIITPPDVITQILLALPLCGLYELTILLCTLLAKNDRYQMDQAKSRTIGREPEK